MYVHIYIHTVVVKSLNQVLHFCNPARQFPLCLGAPQPPAPGLECFSLHPSALHPFLLRRFGVFQNGRPPTTPLDSARREQSTGAIGESPRCSVAKLLRIKDCTSGGGSIWYKLVPVQVDECPGGRSARIPIRAEVAPFAAMHAKTAAQRVMMLQRNFPYTG